MTESELRRIERVEVDKLFGIYDHSIDLKLDDRVTLLHGPNGTGKTVVLRMIDALLNDRRSYLRRIPFSRIAIRFHDGTEMELHKSRKDEVASTLKLYEGGKERSFPIHLRTGAERIAASIGHLHPHPEVPDTWIDIRDDELLSSAEIISRYGDHGSPSRAKGDSSLNPTFSAFLKTANTHLIEAQRLFPFGRDQRERSRRRHWQSLPGYMVSTVVEYSNGFRNMLARTMADYGRRSQALDQSFPQRLIAAQGEMPAQEGMSVEMLGRRISELEDKTAELKEIGILEETQVRSIPVGRLENIDPAQARVMELYVNDTTKKLAELDYLKDRSRLLLKKINQKYQHKSIRVDSEHGLVAESTDGQDLELDCLSSGEQHELVLYYDLLFKVPSNTIVLIDEPELSLHVMWQKEFLPDLLEIVELADFDALVATHSPYIIGDRDDLMIGIGGSN